MAGGADRLKAGLQRGLIVVEVVVGIGIGVALGDKGAEAAGHGEPGGAAAARGEAGGLAHPGGELKNRNGRRGAVGDVASGRFELWIWGIRQAHVGIVDRGTAG